MVACSGGPDSVCLLDIFAKLAPKYNLKLIIAHVNYGLRGKDSDKDAVFVAKLASRYKLKLVEIKLNFSSRSSASSGQDNRDLKRGSASLNQNGPKRPNLLKLPSENKLREIRYEFFEKVRAKNKFDLIAVGHILDDQTETFLMRIIRGSGLAGMASMKFKTGRIIRPLLGTAKKEILEYLDRTGRTYRTDRTNKKTPFLRNKIRNELIPLLEKKYNPNIKEVLYRSSLTIAEDYDLISEITEKYYKKHKNLKTNELLKLHPTLQKRVILKAIENIKPDLKDIESAHINEIMKIIKSAKSKRQIMNFQGLKIIRIGDKIIVSLNK